MEKRTLTSVVALTFLMAGTATFAMDDDKQNQSQYVYSFPQNFKKGDQLEILIDAKEGEVLPSIRININEKISGGMFSWGSKSVKKHIIGSIFEKKENSSQSLPIKSEEIIIQNSLFYGWNRLETRVIPAQCDFTEEKGIITLKTNGLLGESYLLESLPLKNLQKKDKIKVSFIPQGTLEGVSFAVRDIKNRRLFPEKGLSLKNNELIDFETEIPENAGDEISVVFFNWGATNATDFTVQNLKIEKEQVINDTSSLLQTETNLETINDYQDIDQVNTPTSSVTVSQESNTSDVSLKPTTKKRGGFWSWFFSQKEEEVTQEDNIPSDEAYLSAALQMKNTHEEHFNILMTKAKATGGEIPEGTQEALSTLMNLSRSVKDIQSFESQKLTEDELQLQSFLKKLRKVYLLKLQNQEKKIQINQFEKKPTQSFIFSIPIDNKNEEN